MLTLLTSLTATAAGKAAVALTGLTIAGGGAAIATDGFSTGAEDQLADVTEQLDERHDTDEETLEVFQEELDTPDHGNDDSDEAENEGRSEAVHDALTGEDSDLTPEDGRDFGQQVAENARDGGVGGDVSEAARDGNGEEASAEGQSRSETGQDRADEARTQAPAPSDDADDEDSDTASTDADDRADAGAGNADNGKGQGGR